MAGVNSNGLAHHKEEQHARVPIHSAESYQSALAGLGCGAVAGCSGLCRRGIPFDHSGPAERRPTGKLRASCERSGVRRRLIRAGGICGG